MNRHIGERRSNLATIVGSGLAAVAAGSLLAFSSLAEQAGLQGLATGRIEPAVPARGGGTRAIRLPAPAEPADPIEQVVRDTFARADSLARPAPRVTPGAPVVIDRRPDEKEKKEKPRRRPERPSAVIAFAPREATGDTDTAGGPTYGNAYGHDKKPKKPKPAKHGHGEDDRGKAGSGPMYARGAGDDSKASKHEPTTWERAKPKKAKAAKHPGGNANGHSKHAHDNGNGKGKGKGKGHSKHGH